ncbi:MAG: hypothetical protein NT107_00035 [Planctomycetota bacterium]|nr:hypothetical protein [Planctomycetota bacterium]
MGAGISGAGVALNGPTRAADDDRTESQPATVRTQLIFWLAVACLLAAGLHGISGPWELGWRGIMGGQWAEGAIVYYQRYGLGVTGLYPTVVIDNGDDLRRIVNWHHPATYWLYLALPASVFGNSPPVLRLAHLVLWLPSVVALRQLVVVRAGARWANVAALLFATTPVVAYYGPMVVQTGAVYGLGLVTLWRFDRWLRAGGRRNAMFALAAFFVTCLTDFPACWWGGAIAVLGLGSGSSWRYFVHVGSMALTGVTALAIVVVHFGLEFNGPLNYLQMLRGLGNEDVAPIAWARIELALHAFLLDHGCLPVVMLALFGVLRLVFLRRGMRGELALLAVSLAVPGVIDCVALPAHAVDHVFWPMQAMSAVALLAAGLACPMAGGGGVARWLRTPSAWIVGVTTCWGLVWTHVVADRFHAPPEPHRARLEQAAPLLAGCTWSFTNLPKTTRVFYGDSWVHTEFRSAEQLMVVRQFARAQGAAGPMAFVLDRATASEALRAAVEALATPTASGDLEVYRFRP